MFLVFEDQLPNDVGGTQVWIFVAGEYFFILIFTGNYLVEIKPCRLFDGKIRQRILYHDLPYIVTLNAIQYL